MSMPNTTGRPAIEELEKEIGEQFRVEIPRKENGEAPVTIQDLV